MIWASEDLSLVLSKKTQNKCGWIDNGLPVELTFLSLITAIETAV